jgi:hypothetical protein
MPLNYPKITILSSNFLKASKTTHKYMSSKHTHTQAMTNVWQARKITNSTMCYEELQKGNVLTCPII